MCVNKYKQIEHCLIIAVLAFYPIQLVIPPPQNVGGGWAILDSLCPVGRSVRLQFVSAL